MLGAPGVVHPQALAAGVRGSTSPTCRLEPRQGHRCPAGSHRRWGPRRRDQHCRTPHDVASKIGLEDGAELE
jgi:hypothetical protein